MLFNFSSTVFPSIHHTIAAKQKEKSSSQEVIKTEQHPGSQRGLFQLTSREIDATIRNLQQTESKLSLLVAYCTGPILL